jgi:hypothetical protein
MAEGMVVLSTSEPVKPDEKLALAITPLSL